jgi:hypothetical protein
MLESGDNQIKKKRHWESDNLTFIGYLVPKQGCCYALHISWQTTPLEVLVWDVRCVDRDVYDIENVHRPGPSDSRGRPSGQWAPTVQTQPLRFMLRRRDCTVTVCGWMGTEARYADTLVLVRELQWDAKSEGMVVFPTPELALLQNATLTAGKPMDILPAGSVTVAVNPHTPAAIGILVYPREHLQAPGECSSRSRSIQCTVVIDRSRSIPCSN